MAEYKFEGVLTFDINSGSFWITNDGVPVTQLAFGDSFEVKNQEGKWVSSGIEISSDAEGNLLFKLKNTNFEVILDGIEARV